jgi:hypothetical protein
VDRHDYVTNQYSILEFCWREGKPPKNRIAGVPLKLNQTSPEYNAATSAYSLLLLSVVPILFSVFYSCWMKRAVSSVI